MSLLCKCHRESPCVTLLYDLQNILLRLLDPSPWDLQCFMGIFAFLVTPVAPVQSQISSYSLTSILLDCRRSRPAFCKAMSNFPISAIKYYFPWRTNSTFWAGLQIRQDVLKVQGVERGRLPVLLWAVRRQGGNWGGQSFKPWLR